MEEKKKLTGKQEQFCHEYLVDNCGTQAAIRAGYSEHTANEIAAQNLAKLSIQKRIAELRAEVIEKTKMSPEWVLKRLSDVYEKCMMDKELLNKEGNPTGIRKFDSTGANKALELIGKTFGMFIEKSETNNKNETSLSLDISTEEVKSMADEIRKAL